jgi:hypothetical protein
MHMPPREAQRLRQCIQACQAQGFELDDPSDMPAPPNPAPPPEGPWVIPEDCQARPPAASSPDVGASSTGAALTPRAG